MPIFLRGQKQFVSILQTARKYLFRNLSVEFTIVVLTQPYFQPIGLPRVLGLNRTTRGKPTPLTFGKF
jgi:hypothetical protein